MLHNWWFEVWTEGEIDWVTREEVSGFSCFSCSSSRELMSFGPVQLSTRQVKCFSLARARDKKGKNFFEKKTKSKTLFAQAAFSHLTTNGVTSPHPVIQWCSHRLTESHEPWSFSITLDRVHWERRVTSHPSQDKWCDVLAQLNSVDKRRLRKRELAEWLVERVLPCVDWKKSVQRVWKVTLQCVGKIHASL